MIFLLTRMKMTCEYDTFNQRGFFFIAEPKKLYITHVLVKPSITIKKKCNQFLNKIKYGFDRNV